MTLVKRVFLRMILRDVSGRQGVNGQSSINTRPSISFVNFTQYPEASYRKKEKRNENRRK